MSVLLLVVALLALVYFAVTEILDWHGRLEVIDKRWPVVGRIMRDRTARLVLMIVLSGLIAEDIKKQCENDAPPILRVTIVPPPPPEVRFVSGNSHSQQSRPISADEEVRRRYALLDKLRNEYILENPAVDADLLAKKTYPPVEWINIKLKSLGESWRFQDRDHPFRLSQYDAMTNAELQNTALALTQQMSQWTVANPRPDLMTFLGRPNEPRDEAMQQFEHAYQQYSSNFVNTFFPTARALVAAMEGRNPTPSNLPANDPLRMGRELGKMTLSAGFLAGATPETDVIFYVRDLANSLPVKPTQPQKK